MAKKNTGKSQGKVREFCQSGKVGTLQWLFRCPVIVPRHNQCERFLAPVPVPVPAPIPDIVLLHL